MPYHLCATLSALAIPVPNVTFEDSSMTCQIILLHLVLTAIQVLS